jgi:hypothetical protein
MTNLPLTINPAPLGARRTHSHTCTRQVRPLGFTKRMQQARHPLPLAFTRTYGATGLRGFLAAFQPVEAREEAARREMEHDALRLHRRGYRITGTETTQSRGATTWRVRYERR